MYSRALLFKRYSRLAALYSILEIGRQPSLGGRGFAMADAEASNDAVMTTATGKLFWRTDTSPSIFATCYRYAANSSSNAFASFRSRVSNPSVNHP